MQTSHSGTSGGTCRHATTAGVGGSSRPPFIPASVVVGPTPDRTGPGALEDANLSKRVDGPRVVGVTRRPSDDGTFRDIRLPHLREKTVVPDEVSPRHGLSPTPPGGVGDLWDRTGPVHRVTCVVLVSGLGGATGGGPESVGSHVAGSRGVTRGAAGEGFRGGTG